MADGRVEYEIRADDSKLDEDLKKSEEKMQKSAEKTAEKQKAAEEKSVENTKKANKEKVQAAESSDNKIEEHNKKSQQSITETVKKESKKVVNANKDTAEEIVDTGEKAARKIKKSVSGAADESGKSVESMKDKAVSTAKDIGKAFAAILTAVAAVGTAAVKSSIDAESSFAKVKTLLSGGNANDYYNQLMDLSNQTGVSFENLSESMYQALSAGVSEDKAVDFVKSSVNLAKGGFTETATAIDVVTTALNAYGLAAEDAAHVQDVLITTQNKGKTTVDELAHSMGQIIPTAKSVGVSLDQLGAMYATVTANGVATSEATTYMNSMLNELASSSTTASKALSEAASGKSFKQLMSEGESVAEIIARIDSYAKQSGKSMTDMFGSAEAAKAAQILVDNSGKFVDNLDAMVNSSGAAEEAAATMMDTLQEKINQLVTKSKNMLTEIGNELMPIVSNAIDVINENLPDIEKMIDDFAPILASLLDRLLELITDILPQLVAILQPLLEIVVEGFLPAVINLVKFILQFKEAIYVAVAALVAFKTAVAISNIIEMFTSSVKRAEMAQKALNAATSANPFALIATVLLGAAAAYDTFISTTAKLTRETNSLFDSIKKSDEVYKESISTSETEIAVLEKKASRYDELREKTSLTAAEEAELSSIASELQNVLGSNVDVIDSNTQAYNDINAALEKYIENKKTEIELSAKEQRSKEAYTNIEELNKQKQKLEDYLNDLQNNPVEFGKIVLESANASWITGDSPIQKIKKQLEEIGNQIGVEQSYIDDYFELLGEKGDEYVIETNDSVDATDNLSDSLFAASSASDSFANSNENAAQTVSDLTAEMNELSAAFAEQNESGQLSIDATMKLIDSGYSAILMIDEETGAVRINAEAYRDLAKAKIEEKEATLRAARADAAAAYGKKIESAGMLHDAKGVAEAQAAYNAAVSEYDLQLAALGQLKDGIGSVVSGTYSSSTPGGVKKDTASSSSSSKSSSSTSGSSSSSGSSGSSASGGNIISITSYIPTIWDSETETNKKLRKSSGLSHISKSGQLVSINGGAESNVSTKSSKAVGGSASAYETTLSDVVKAVNGLKKSQDEIKITVTSILQCDKRTLAKVTAEGINEITKATGKSPLQ